MGYIHTISNVSVKCNTKLTSNMLQASQLVDCYIHTISNVSVKCNTKLTSYMLQASQLVDSLGACKKSTLCYILQKHWILYVYSSQPADCYIHTISNVSVKCNTKLTYNMPM